MSGTCHYCDDPANHRLRWTQYGGALVTRAVCAKHAARVKGQRGVQVEAVSPLSSLGEPFTVEAEIQAESMGLRL